MRHLSIREEEIVADPLQQERLLRALRIILEQQEDAEASRTLCQSIHPQSATGGYHCPPGAITQTLHAPAGLESAAPPGVSRCGHQRRTARPPGAGSAA